MTKLEEARMLILSLPPEEQVQVATEILNRQKSDLNVETAKIDETLRDRLKGPFQPHENPSEHFAQLRSHYAKRAAELSNKDG